MAVDGIAVKNGNLVVNVPVSSKGEASKTGKTTIHYSTHGFQRIDGTDYRISVLVTKEAK